MAAVEAGLPTFCEKPVAPDVDGHPAVLRRSRGADVPVHIGFQRRFDAGYVAARAAVESGELGWVHTLRAGTLDPAPPPAEYIAHSGGFFRDCSVHDFDILRWVTGREVVEVYAVGANRGEAFFAELRRRRRGVRPADPTTTAPSPTSPEPVTTQGVTTSASRCSAPRTASRSASTTGCRCARSSPA